MPKSATPKPVKDLNYEQALAELEGILSALENDQKSLDESMKIFERGQALVARCNELLEAAELKVKKISGDALIPFEDDSS
ncbi:MAG TPA: exodeoxyribonuclease VII small subunit [Anaerolineales bacterium]|jgi:exodeoxyribonuclease VII small subunit